MSTAEVERSLLHGQLKTRLEAGRHAACDAGGVAHSLRRLAQVKLQRFRSLLRDVGDGSALRGEGGLQECRHGYPGAYGRTHCRQFFRYLVDLDTLLGKHGARALLSLGGGLPLPEEVVAFMLPGDIHAWQQQLLALREVARILS